MVRVACSWYHSSCFVGFLSVVKVGMVKSIILWIAVTAAMPDPVLTPGATNPAITQTTIAQTICNKHWSTKSIRPSVSYTNRIKRDSMKAYHRTGSMKDYELDHLISLELGGAAADPMNLWPEPYEPRPNAHEKDVVENFLHKEVCSGNISLRAAQYMIVHDWIGTYNKIPKKKKIKAAMER